MLRGIEVIKRQVIACKTIFANVQDDRSLNSRTMGNN